MEEIDAETKRTDIFTSAEDYALWQSVEDKVFDSAFRGQAVYEQKIRSVRMGILLGDGIFTLLFWSTLTVFSLLIISGIVAYVLRFVGYAYRGEYREKLEEFLRDELSLMRDILKRSKMGHIDAVDVHSSPWVNTRYLLRKKY